MVPLPFGHCDPATAVAEADGAGFAVGRIAACTPRPSVIGSGRAARMRSGVQNAIVRARAEAADGAAAPAGAAVAARSAARTPASSASRIGRRATNDITPLQTETEPLDESMVRAHRPRQW